MRRATAAGGVWWWEFYPLLSSISWYRCVCVCCLCNCICSWVVSCYVPLSCTVLFVQLVPVHSTCVLHVLILAVKVQHN